MNLAIKAGQVTIGDKSVNRLGLGTNRITDSPQAHELLLKAIELGVNFIDTAHRYGNGASEITIGNTLTPYPLDLVVTTKGGYNYSGEAGSAEALRRDLEDSLLRLKTNCIELYQLHRVDPKVPIEVSLQAFKSFQAEGKIRHLGLSEVSIDQIKAAQEVADIVSVQNEYNLLSRQHEDVVDYCTEHKIVFMPWYPLGGLSGGAEQVADRLADLAKKYLATPQQIALAWLLKRSPMMLPIPGTISTAHLQSNLRAGEIELSQVDYNEINAIV